jgi:ketosteroid isomerase-like protein
MHANALILQQFYRAFQNRDAPGMAACYAPDARFSDPVFPDLAGQEVADMWQMLTTNARDFELEFGEIHADDERGDVRWRARYTFSKTGRAVTNSVHAHFQFKNGKILRHRDNFNFWRWSQQALGWQGVLLGWTPVLKNAVRKQAAQSLAKFRKA